ncbi:MAG: signal recognition particle protein [Acholeplasmatales bacterium]|jgi:signal recognition particle subunit SRP54|nr:signal recognition particle protein [Acholeplasmatales bacterium]
MENSLTERLSMLFRRIGGKNSLNEKDIDEMMKEVRLSLLEADVNIKVVRELSDRIKEKALGEKILKGLNPSEQVVKVVRDELRAILGGETAELNIKQTGQTIIMAIGLQGSGKTTSITKLALHIEKTYQKKVLLVACDIYRPAAINQLKTLGENNGIKVFEEGQIDVVKIAQDALKYAKEFNYDCLIIDTAGRLEIDTVMMSELSRLKKSLVPDEILLTVDSLMGQQAANVAKEFHDKIVATGVILTKLDGDSRGGAALSVKFISNVPIKFSSSGEKMDSFEVFHPDRLADRILGMGDILTLIEKVEDNISEDEANSLMEKMTGGTFDFNDMLKQFKTIKKMGSLSKILGFIPGLSQMKNIKEQVGDSQINMFEAIISSMTKEERVNADLIDMSSRRRERIARGSGYLAKDVKKVYEALEKQQKMAKQLSRMQVTEEEASELEKDPSKLFSSSIFKK